MEVRGRRVTLMGLGRHGGGVAAARWLAEQGAVVSVTDQAGPEAFADSLAALAGVKIARWQLAGHREEEFDSADLVVVNPAVRPEHPLVARAAARGARITSELELFLERCPGQVIGVTGSNGKSTTAAMIAAILRAEGRATFLGGNIGKSLLPELAAMDRDSRVVLEISSFQLTWLSAECRLPEIAVLTGFAPNHLDWHGFVSAYAAAKMRMFQGQKPGDIAVLDDTNLSPQWARAVRGRRIEPMSDALVPRLAVPGEHNRRNARLAGAAAQAAGCSQAAIERGLRDYRGLPHRLEWIGTHAGRDFYNDSMATTPESTVAALETFSGRMWLLAGGYDKGADLASVAAAAVRHARGAAFFGATGPRLFAQLRQIDGAFPAALFARLEDAFSWSVERARPGDSIILSPACASLDQFADYRARGERFCAQVRAIDDATLAQEMPLRTAPARCAERAEAPRAKFSG